MACYQGGVADRDTPLSRPQPPEAVAEGLPAKRLPERAVSVRSVRPNMSARSGTDTARSLSGYPPSWSRRKGCPRF
jgi:hypothetical protein